MSLQKMVILFLFIFVEWCGMNSVLNAQVDVGAYYSFLYDSDYYTKDLRSVRLYQHHINLSGRWEFYRKTYAGMDFSYMIMDGPEVPNPFVALGVWLEYKLIFSKYAALYPRLGISQGNLSFADIYLPIRRPVTSRVLGLSADFRLTKAFYLWTGLINHFPLNKIPYKYSFSQPFLGVRIFLNPEKK